MLAFSILRCQIEASKTEYELNEYKKYKNVLPISMAFARTSSEFIDDRHRIEATSLTRTENKNENFSPAVRKFAGSYVSPFHARRQFKEYKLCARTPRHPFSWREFIKTIPPRFERKTTKKKLLTIAFRRNLGTISPKRVPTPPRVFILRLKKYSIDWKTCKC